MVSRREFLVTSNVAVLGGESSRQKTRVALVDRGIRGASSWGREPKRSYDDGVDIVGSSSPKGVPASIARRLFHDTDGPVPSAQRAGLRERVVLALVGIAARKSVSSDQPVHVGDLTSPAAEVIPWT